MALWTPEDLQANQILWLDASDTSTITASAGIVSQWDDKSSSGNHATQSVSGSRPSISTLNGYSALSFTNKYLTVPHHALFNGSSGLSIFIVLKTAQTTINTGPIGKWGSAWIYTTRASASPNRVMFYITGNSAQSSAGVNDSVAHVLSGVFTPGVNTTHWIDGDGAFSCATGSISSDTSAVTIGSIYTGSGYFDGIIAEVIAYAASLNKSDRQIIEGYLAWKWGSNTLIPVGHPYYSSAPVKVVTQTVIGNFTVNGGGAGDYVAILDANDSAANIGNGTPDGAGNWSAVIPYGSYYFLFVADGYPSEVSGPHTVSESGISPAIPDVVLSSSSGITKTVGYAF